MGLLSSSLRGESVAERKLIASRILPRWAPPRGAAGLCSVISSFALATHLGHPHFPFGSASAMTSPLLKTPHSKEAVADLESRARTNGVLAAAPGAPALLQHARPRWSCSKVLP